MFLFSLCQESVLEIKTKIQGIKETTFFSVAMIYFSALYPNLNCLCQLNLHQLNIFVKLVLLAQVILQRKECELITSLIAFLGNSQGIREDILGRKPVCRYTMKLRYLP